MTGAFSTSELTPGGDAPPRVFWCAWRDASRAGPARRPDAHGVADGEAAAATAARAAIVDPGARREAGAAFHWRHLRDSSRRRKPARGSQPRPRAATKSRPREPACPPIDELRPGLGVMGVCPVDGGRYLWVAWATAERVREGRDPSAWGVHTPDPIYAQLGASHLDRLGATCAAAAWLELHAPATFRGSACVDSLARWWLQQLRARGQMPAARPVAAPEFARVLGLAWPADRAAVVRAYRRRALETHPDRGGDAAVFIAVRHAYEQALAATG